MFGKVFSTLKRWFALWQLCRIARRLDPRRLQNVIERAHDLRG